MTIRRGDFSYWPAVETSRSPPGQELIKTTKLINVFFFFYNKIPLCDRRVCVMTSDLYLSRVFSIAFQGLVAFASTAPSWLQHHGKLLVVTGQLQGRGVEGTNTNRK